LWSKEKYHVSILTFCIAFIHFWVVKDFPFFWDSIQLTSKQATHFFENGYGSLVLPEEINSGHPPFMGLYMSTWWLLLSRQLWVSHLAMLPFVWIWLWVGFLWIDKLCSIKNINILCKIVFLSEPLWLTQATIMGPDIVLVAAMSVVVWSYFHDKKILLLLGSIVLGLISMRGAMVLCGIGIFHILYTFLVIKKDWRYLLSVGWPMIPGSGLFLGFLFMHYQLTGWVAFHPNSPWAESFQRSDFIGFLKNGAVFIFRSLEFGKFFAWFILIVGIWRFRHALNFLQVFLLGLLLTVSILLWINTLPYAHLSANRYFWPIQFLVLLLSFSFLDTLWVKTRFTGLMLGLWVVVFLSTHFWNYNGRISQDWESTLIHLPYHKHRKAVSVYLKDQEDNWSSVETAFPGVNSEYLIFLLGDQVLPQISGAHIATYLFYSDIMNDIDRNQLDAIQKLYKPVLEFEAYNGVRSILFKRM
jgi:hypothetical protein